MRVLLTGGAGFIGSHTAVALSEAGHTPLIVDDLSNAVPDVVDRIGKITGTTPPALFADVRDEAALDAFIKANGPVDAVIHLAGLKAVGESVAQPARYYDVNIGSTLALLRVMARNDITNLVFSSSATVYGSNDDVPFTEETPTGTGITNPYGQTKFMIEQILRDVAVANPELRVTSLRYFNPVGAHPSAMIGEDPLGMPNNLMPVVARAAAGILPEVVVFGTDYQTPDGTGLRDYIHVLDLADGHVAASERAQAGFTVYNLGTGVPSSVRDVIAEYSRACGHEVPAREEARRPGDVATSFADPTKAERELGWKATRTLADACRDNWAWQSGEYSQQPA